MSKYKPNKKSKEKSCLANRDLLKEGDLFVPYFKWSAPGIIDKLYEDRFTGKLLVSGRTMDDTKNKINNGLLKRMYENYDLAFGKFYRKDQEGIFKLILRTSRTSRAAEEETRRLIALAKKHRPIY